MENACGITAMLHLKQTDNPDGTMQPRIPGYRIGRELGRGGMAVVYLAHQESLQRPVALKVMAPALASDEDFTQRFLKEGPTVARLSHPGIVKVFDTGVHRDQYYLAMEYLPGGTLKQRIRQGLQPIESIGMLRSIAQALGYAHRQGFIHRDVKGQNILLRDTGEPVLTDFGIAKALGNSTHLTSSGLSIGSPHYMSPEQLQGTTVDQRADLYALGILFHEMLTGKLPYTADNGFAIAYQHVNAPLPRLPAPLAAFQPLIDKTLAKQPEDRFPNAEALVRAIDDVEAGYLEKIRSPTVRLGTPSTRSGKRGAVRWGSRWRVAVAVLVVVALAGAGIHFYLDRQARLTAATQHYRTLLFQARQALQQQDFAAGLNAVTEGLTLRPDDAELLQLRQALQDQRAEQERRRAGAERQRLAFWQEQQRAERERRRQADQLLSAAQKAWDAGEAQTSLALIDRGLAVLPESPQLLNLRRQIQQRLAQQTERERTVRPSKTTPSRVVETPSTPVADTPAAPKQTELRLESRSRTVSETVVRTASMTDDTIGKPSTTQTQISTTDTGAQVSLATNTLPDVAPPVQQPSELERLRVLAERQLGDWKLTTPADDNAYDTYRRLARLDGGQAVADRGFQAIAERYLQLARKHRQAGRLAQSLDYIARGLEISPNDGGLLALRQEVETLQMHQARARASSPAGRSTQPQASITEKASEPAPPTRRFGTF